MKKIFLLMMAVTVTCNVMATNVWDGTSQPWIHGNGTSDDPYLIETAANLAYLAEQVNAGYEAEGQAVFANTYFLMTDDLDLNNIDWTSIGHVNTNYEGLYFAGVFDGDFHTISNLKIQTDADVTGLFACLADGTDGFWNPAVIENLSVTNGTITSTGQGAGGIVGAIGGNALVYRCAFSGNINVTNMGSYCGGGGIVAVMTQNSRVRECSFTGTIQATNNNYMGAAGGGGIAGVALGNSSIQHCYYTGSITATAMILSVAAGIVAATLEENQVTVASCYSVGSLNAINKGGIFGMISPINPFRGATEIDVSNCYYLNTTAFNNGYGTGMTADEMKTEQFKNQLDQSTHAFVMDNGTNNGYPIHGLTSFRYLPVTDLTCHSAKLHARIHQGNDVIERAFFQYKHWEADEWIELEVASDGDVEAELEDLEPETYYEYALVLTFADGIALSGAPMGFQTEVDDAVGDAFHPVKVYPNPTTEVVRIEGFEVTEIQVYNTLGQMVKAVSGMNEINISGLPEGIYQLRIKDRQGNVSGYPVEKLH